MTPERYERLMVRVTDGVASPDEREELMDHLAQHPDLQLEFEAHRALKAVTDGWMARLEADLLEDRNRTSRSGQVERGVGTTLLLTGMAILVAYVPIEVILREDVPMVVKAGLITLGGGSLLLLWHVGRLHFTQRNADPYKEIVR